MPPSQRQNRLLQGARVYLSGPMDFVASRAAEKQFGWRNRVGEFLQMMGVTVFDPWFKPDVRGSAAVINPPLPVGVEPKAFAMTIEPEQGSSTPTMPIVMVGAGE